MPATLLRLIPWLVMRVPVALAAVWSMGALYFDFPWPAARLAATAAFGSLLILIPWRLPQGRLRWAAAAAACAMVATWWLTLRPSHDRVWLPDAAHLPRATINGDIVTLSNVRNCDYRTATDFTPRWETRTVDLSQLTGFDVAITYWGSPWIAHPVASFTFADAPPVCFSIETRKEVGEKYSALGGLYRGFELMYVVADERDVLRLRTSFRQGEEVYLYRTTATPAEARQRFLEYLRALNHLYDHPRWYNALTTNCTTTVRTQREASRRMAWDWRFLVNGKGDELLYETLSIVTEGLPFAELKSRALINPAPLRTDDPADFSRQIRTGRPGF